MAQDISSRWPWETGAMPKQAESFPPRPPHASEVPMYTLPTVKDRRAENGRRPASARDLVRLKREGLGGEARYFRW